MTPRRFPSRPDAMPAPESVYLTLHDHDSRLEEIESKVGSVADKVDRVSDDLRNAVLEIKISNSSETRKLIAAIAGTALTILGGVFGAAKLEHPDPPPPVLRSALDMRLDECRPIHEAGSRAECFSRVFEASPK